MKAIATAETVSGPTEKKRNAWSSYIVFAICGLLYLLPFMRLIALASDEGTVLYDAVRIVHGQVFARDFFEIMGPGSFYWLATFYKLFGVTFVAARMCLFISSFGSALLLYFLSRRICGRYQSLSCIVLVSTCFGGMWPGNNYHVDGTFFALLSVACLVLWLDMRRRVLLISAGVLAGLSTCCLQTKGTLLLLAMLLWLWVQRRKGAASISAFGLLTVGYLGVAGAVLAYFWSQGALRSVFYANVIWPFQHYSNVNAVCYGQGIVIWNWDRYILMKDAFSWPFNLVAYGVAALLVAPLFFVAALPALVPLSALLAIRAGRVKWRTLTPEIVLYLLCGFALWISEIHRMDIGHLAFGAPLLIILCIYLLDEIQSKYSDNVLKLIAISTVWLAGFNFIGVLTAHSVTTRVGSVAVFRDSPALSFLNTHVAANDEIYVYPYAPSYYFLSATTNPTPYSLLLYNYNTSSEFQEVIGILDRRRVKYVIWDTPILAYTAVSFPGAQPKSPKDLIMEPYLESHYKMVSEDHGIRVMERKEAETGN
jgi:4-amino-4-deoxy-L-arabinose transferase-like glycosyltransferase